MRITNYSELVSQTEGLMKQFDYACPRSDIYIFLECDIDGEYSISYDYNINALSNDAYCIFTHYGDINEWELIDDFSNQIPEILELTWADIEYMVAEYTHILPEDIEDYDIKRLIEETPRLWGKFQRWRRTAIFHDFSEEYAIAAKKAVDFGYRNLKEQIIIKGT